MTDFKDGVYQITNDEYHSNAAISRSNLVHFNKNPYHYWYNKLSGETVHKETKDMAMGSLVHTMVLEPHLFDEQYCFFPTLEQKPPEVRLKDVGREQFEQIKQARKEIDERNHLLLNDFNNCVLNKAVVKFEDYGIAKSMQDAVYKEEVAKWLIQDSRIENSIFFTHQSTGLQCKVRPDIWRDNIIGDLKTSKDVSPRAFQRSAMDYYYYLQAGMMKPALASIGIELEKFIIVAVEKEKPYHVGIYMLDDEAIEFGVQQFNRLIEGVASCMEKNEWPGYPVQYLSVPVWANKQEVVE